MRVFTALIDMCDNTPSVIGVFSTYNKARNAIIKYASELELEEDRGWLGDEEEVQTHTEMEYETTDGKFYISIHFIDEE